MSLTDIFPLTTSTSRETVTERTSKPFSFLLTCSSIPVGSTVRCVVCGVRDGKIQRYTIRQHTEERGHIQGVHRVMFLSSSHTRSLPPSINECRKVPGDSTS
jgi:hypothetical protein